MPSSPFQTAAPSSIRAKYQQHGAAAFYQEFGDNYRNPHEPAVVQSLTKAVREWPLDLSDVLDLAAGSGEATLALLALGARKVSGIDPYTAAAFTRRTGRACEPLDFADIAAGALAERGYSLIVCSFALHLCERSRLPALVYQLTEVAPAMLIVTPHKRPEILPEWGWRLECESLLRRVRTRLYRRVN